MKIGLALGGGGAKGYAHLGVIKVLEQAGIKIDLVTGTSIGALVGAIYAAGKHRDLEREVKDLKITDIPGLLSPSWCLSGLFSGNSVFEILGDLIGVDAFSDLLLPFSAVSTDIYSGERIVHSSGSVQSAVRASASIPGIFTPVELNNRVLVDGGLVDPVPVQAAYEMGADFVIAVDLFGHTPNPAAKLGLPNDDGWPTPIKTSLGYLKSLADKLPWSQRLLGEGSEEVGKFENRSEKVPTRAPNLLDIVECTLAHSQRILTEYRLQASPPELLIQPDVTMIDMLDFHRAEIGIGQGVTAGNSCLDQLKAALRQAS